MEKTKNVVIVVLVILVIALVGVVGYFIGANNNENENNINEQQNNNAKQVITNYEHNKGANYVIPYINIEGHEIQNINNEIQGIANRDDVNSTSYTYCIKDDVVSLLYTVNIKDSDKQEKYTYNFDKSENKVLSNTELLEELNIYALDFILKLDNIAYNASNDYISKQGDLTYIDGYSCENINKFNILKLYITSDDKICLASVKNDDSYEEEVYINIELGKIDEFKGQYYSKATQGVLANIVTEGDFVNYYNNDGTLDTWVVSSVSDGKVKIVSLKGLYEYYHGQDVQKSIKALTTDFTKTFGDNSFNKTYAESIRSNNLSDKTDRLELIPIEDWCWAAEKGYSDTTLFIDRGIAFGIEDDKNRTYKVRPIVELKANVKGNLAGYSKGLKVWNISI